MHVRSKTQPTTYSDTAPINKLKRKNADAAMTHGGLPWVTASSPFRCVFQVTPRQESVAARLQDSRKGKGTRDGEPRTCAQQTATEPRVGMREGGKRADGQTSSASLPIDSWRQGRATRRGPPSREATRRSGEEGGWPPDNTVLSPDGTCQEERVNVIGDVAQVAYAPGPRRADVAGTCMHPQWPVRTCRTCLRWFSPLSGLYVFSSVSALDSCPSYFIQLDKCSLVDALTLKRHTSVENRFLGDLSSDRLKRRRQLRQENGSESAK